MNKTLLFLAVLMCGCLGVTQSQTNSQGKAVEQTIIDFFETLSSGDSVKLQALSTPDILLFEYGGVWTLDTLLRKAFRPARPTDFKRINTIDFINTTVEKKTAWTTYRNKAEITSNGKNRIVEWIETVVLVRQQKKWKVKLLHSSLVKQG